jgi:hypothetical protein
MVWFAFYNFCCVYKSLRVTLRWQRLDDGAC